jgi:uncharacterized protein YaaN involved in tellurite resistance
LGILETAAAIKNRIKNFFKKYELVITRLDRQEADIFAKETASTERYYRNVELARLTYKTMLDARIKGRAIEIFLEGERGYAEPQRRQLALAQEREAARTEDRNLDYAIVTAADRYGKYIERLEGKKTALQRVILSAYQTSIAVSMMGANENIIRQKLSDIRTELLPQWRIMFALAYQSYQQVGIAKFVEELEDAESELRDKTGNQIEHSAKETARLMTQTVVDVESMRKYNEKLVSSLEILKTASIESKKIRDAAEKEMQKYTNELGDAVASTSVRTK